MSELQTTTISTEDRDRGIERAILGLLASSPGGRPWSEAELALELGERIATLDAIDRLRRAGIVHRCDGLVFLTRAAIVLDGLVA